MKDDHYDRLGVSPSDDLVTIQRAYRKKAISCHPDRGGSNEMMYLLNESWRILSDPDLRRRYDASRSPQPNTQASEGGQKPNQKDSNESDTYERPNSTGTSRDTGDRNRTYYSNPQPRRRSKQEIFWRNVQFRVNDFIESPAYGWFCLIFIVVICLYGILKDLLS